jgi:hypothetical protein
MAVDRRGEDFSAPTAADASRMLSEITPVTRRSRRLARDVVFARPLLAWGLAWSAGAILFQFLPGVTGDVLGTAACAAAAGVTWLVRPREVRVQNERRFALLWSVLFATSPLLVAVAAPANARILVVFLASVWAVGMLLYGIGVGDIPLAVVGLAILALAAAARVVVPQLAVLVVGMAGGLGMAGLGGWRMRWKRDR